MDVASLARGGGAAILAEAVAASSAADAEGADRPWVAVVPSLDRQSVDLARDAGAAAMLVQPGSSDEQVALADPAVVATPALLSTGAGNPVAIVPDAALGNALAGTGAAPAVRAANVVAESAFAAMAAPDGEAIVISPGTSWMLDSDHKSPALAALAECPWNRLVTLTSLLEGEPSTEAVVPDVVADAADIPAGQVGSAQNRLRDLRYLADATSAPRGDL